MKQKYDLHTKLKKKPVLTKTEITKDNPTLSIVLLRNITLHH